MRYWFIIVCLISAGCGSGAGDDDLVVPTLVEFASEIATVELPTQIPTVVVAEAVLVTETATDIPASETALPTDIATLIPSPTTTSAIALQFEREDLYFIPEEFMALTSLDGTVLIEDVALVVIGTLRNDGNRSECVVARDVRLLLNDAEYAPQGYLMSAYQQTLDPSIDYIGGFAGQCVNRNNSERTFVVFDIPIDFEDVSLRFGEDTQNLGIILSPILREIDVLFSLDEAFDLSTQEGTRIADNQIAQAQASGTASQWTVTPSPTITATATMTLVPPTMTSVPLPTSAPTSFSTSTFYISGTTANVRSDATTQSDALGSVFWGDEIEVIRTLDGQAISGSTIWYEIEIDNGIAYIHSSLVSRNRPSTAVPQSVAPQSVAPQAVEPQSPAPQSSYTCNCSRTCGVMTCEEAYFQLNQCGCSQRDNDSDGVPCESVCPGG